MPARKRKPAPRRRKRPAKRKGRGRRGSRRRPWLRRLLLLAGVVLGLISLLLFWAGGKAALIDISDLNELPERTLVYDFRGREIGSLHGESRVIIPLADVPPSFVDALLAREDDRFRGHGGVDWFGVARAAVRNVREGEIVQGASTLTMQLARNRFALRGRNFHRKMVEAMLAKRLERTYSKDQILEAYLNVIYFGSGQYGLEKASRAYFEKPTRELALAESALLVGLIRSPNTFSPFSNLEGARKEMAVVLDRMVETGRLDRAAAEAAKAAPLAIRPPERRTLLDNWTMDLVRGELDLLLDEEDLNEGGLRVFTTLDRDIQAALEEAMETHLASFEKGADYPHQTRAQYAALLERMAEGETPPPPRYLQGAAIFLDNGTGGIRGLVGGRDVKHSRFNRAWQARRQVGSLFKPFVYAAAFAAGMSPTARVDDGPLRRGEIARAPRGWSPRNADGTHRGLQPASFGLVKSRNTMSVRVGNAAGLDNVRTLADRAGLAEDLPRYPAVYLGAFESSPRDLTAAFTMFPNLGSRSRPYLVEEIQDKRGRAIYRAARAARPPVLPRAACRTTSRILQQVTAPGGTGAGVRNHGVGFPCAGKTGTTDNYRDAWFVGYTNLVTGGVWVGFDDPRQSLAGGYGARLALPIWARTMARAEQAGYRFGRLP